MKYLPHDTEELILELEKQYPARCIKPNESPEDAHRYAGKVDLIQYLKDLRHKTEVRQMASQQTIGD